MTSSIPLAGLSGSLHSNSYSTAILSDLSEASAPRARVKSLGPGILPLYNWDLGAGSLPDEATRFRANIAQVVSSMLALPVSTEEICHRSG